MLISCFDIRQFVLIFSDFSCKNAKIWKYYPDPFMRDKLLISATQNANYNV